MAEKQATKQTFFATLRDLIARDELDAALAQLRELLAHSPLLDEAIHHEGRFTHIRKQIRLGTVSHQEATLTQNQIRAALLDLITAIEQQAAEHSVGVTRSHADTTAQTLRAEVEQAISIVQSKNVVKDSPISSGRDTHIGDKTEIHHHHGDKKIPRLLTTPPFNTDLFLGRENDLNAIEADYQQNNRLLVLVNGEGGIGKTTLASKYWYAHEARYQHLAWLYADTGIGTALVTLKEKLGVTFAPEDTLETQVQRMAEALSNLQAPCLLVFDNANNETDLKQHYALLNRLSNCHILLTSRVRKVANMKTHEVKPLTPEEAVELFKTHYPDLTEAELPLLRDVLQAVGHNTLVTEVLAKNLAALNRFALRYTLADLLRDLQAQGLLALKNKTVAVVYGSDTLREAQPTNIIAAMYDLAQLDDAERYILSNFAVLPAESIPYHIVATSIIPASSKPSMWEKVKSFFFHKKKVAITEAVIQSHLETLETKGWIEYRKSDNSFKISPVIQEVTKAKNAERLLGDCRTLVNTLLRGLNSDNRHTDNYQPAAVFARLGAAVVQALLIDDDVATLCQNIGWYHQDTGNLSGMMQYYQKMLDIQTALCAAEPDNADFKNGLAISYEKLGSTHTALGNLTQALIFFEIETKLFEALHDAFPQNVDFKNGLASSYEKLGSTHTDLGNLTQALTFFEERNRLGKALHDAFPQNVAFKNGLAISYSKLGETHTDLGNLTQALTFFEERNRLGKALHDAFPQNVAFKNGLAISYSKLGETHTALGNLTQALAFFENYNQLETALHEAYPQNVAFKNGLAISYSKLGETHTALGNLTQALTFFEERNRLGKELHDAFPQNVAFKNGLAISYEKLGSTHTALGNLTQALTFFENYNQLEKELHDAFPQNVEFKNGLAISYEKLGSTHTALGNLTQALTFFEERNRLSKELHDSYPQNVEFKNGLAISCEKLGSTHTALGNLTQALVFFERYNVLEKELYDSHPQNVAFKNGLATSYLFLGQFYKNQMKDESKARPFIQKGYELYVELVQDFPYYQSFKGNYEWAKKQLGYQ